MEAITLLIAIIVAILVIATIAYLISNISKDQIDKIEVTITVIENAEWKSGTLYQCSTSPAKIKLELKVLDTKNSGVDGAKVEITGPGFTMIPASTDKYGKAVIDDLTFDLPGSEGAFITIKASGGQSTMGGDVTKQIPVRGP